MTKRRRSVSSVILFSIRAKQLLIFQVHFLKFRGIALVSMIEFLQRLVVIFGALTTMVMFPNRFPLDSKRFRNPESLVRHFAV
jgi:hypothetical protein